MIDNKLDWDGSYLGKFKKEEVVKDSKQDDQFKYFQISFCLLDNSECKTTSMDTSKDKGDSMITPVTSPASSDVESRRIIKIWCIARKVTSNLTCLVDEMKVHFGIVKLGTHSIKLNDSLYVLIRLYDDKGKHIRYVPFNSVNTSKEPSHFFQHLREIYVFRHIFGLTSSYGTSLMIFSFDLCRIPIDFYIYNTKAECGGTVIGKKLYEDLFDKETMPMVCERMTCLETYRLIEMGESSEDLESINSQEIYVGAKSRLLIDLENEIKITIKRIDKSKQHLAKYIIDKVCSLLSVPSE